MEKMVAENSQKHILSLLVDNKPGVLARIAGLFSARNYNIESLCVSETNDPTISRITLVTKGGLALLEQIKKQLNKLIDVIKVMDFTHTDFVQVEAALVKLRVKPEFRSEILWIVNMYRSRVVDTSPDVYTLEVVGDEGEIEAFLNLLKPMGIREIARTGTIALAREKKKRRI
ncbi:MAG: acetolactate synthase small subunit [Thermodesulfobacteriota bacterium]